MHSVAIVDYGCGNLFNLQKALNALKASRYGIVTHGTEIPSYDKIILPGVGAFQTGMTQLVERDFDEPLREHASKQKPILGICLGMQLLMSSSEEFGFCRGLDLVEGRIVSLRTVAGVGDCTLPNVGWASVRFHPVPGGGVNQPRFQTLVSSAVDRYFYFTHSFAASLDHLEHALCSTDFHAGRFASIVCKDYIIGVQFHPELSGKTGLKFLQTFLEWKGW